MKTKITQEAYHTILQTVASEYAEKGGLLLGSPEDTIITHFLYDKNAQNTATSYTINHLYLNPILKKLWKEKRLNILGVLHSHPTHCRKLSPQDIRYFLEQFKHLEVDFLFVPIVFSAKDGVYDFIPYIIHRNGKVEVSTLEIVPNDYKQCVITTAENAEVKQLQNTLESFIQVTENNFEKVTQQINQIEFEDTIDYEKLNSFQHRYFTDLLKHFSLKKWRLFLWNFLLLVIVLTVSLIILDLGTYFSQFIKNWIL